jgi:type IV pilus assembly protein PilA
MKKNNKGFTLAELLIVVAIIAVLTAVAIPIFTTQLEKSREETDIANMRAAKAAAVAYFLDNPTENTVFFNATSGAVQKNNAGIAAYGKGTTTVGAKETFDIYELNKAYNGKIIQVKRTTDTTTGLDTITLSWVNAAT